MNMKRSVECILSCLVMIVLSPLYVMIGLLILVDVGWPIIYKKRYPGLHEKQFTMYRFRTMRNLTDRQGKLLLPKERVTKLGRFLIKYHLDDLPQFFNVLRGDMSLVGPRPVLIRSIPARDRRQLKRHSVRPGMTGWSQLHGQKRLTWEEKFELDLYYIEHQNLWFDLKILALSLLQLFGWKKSI